jgi:hypothetical protein
MLDDARFLDFAIIWDEDHDDRVLEPIEKIYLAGLLPHFLVFGERKGGFSAIVTDDSPRISLLKEQVNEITQHLTVGDSWHTMIGTMEEPGPIISEGDEQVALYLGNIMMLSRLGVKPATYEDLATSRMLLHSPQTGGQEHLDR